LHAVPRAFAQFAKVPEVSAKFAQKNCESSNVPGGIDKARINGSDQVPGRTDMVGSRNRAATTIGFVNHNCERLVL
jgi:hypothetical protein